jgi:hypothetical protein
LPKARGFTRYFKLVKDFQIVNLGKLNQDERVTDTMEISKASLKDLGYIAHVKGLVKILGDGEYTKHLTFTDIDAFSTSAQAKIATPGSISSKPSRVYNKIEKKVKTKKVIKKAKATPKKVVEKVVAKKAVEKASPVADKPVTKAAPKKVVEKIVEKKVAPKKVVEKKAPTSVGKPAVADKPAKKAPVKKAPAKKA